MANQYSSVTQNYINSVLSAEDESSIKAFLSVQSDVSISSIVIDQPVVDIDGVDTEIVPGATGMRLKAATFEDGRIKLDGTYQFIDGDPAEWGPNYVGGWVYPNEATSVTMTATQSAATDLSGFTIVFDDLADEYAENVDVSFYDSSNNVVGVYQSVGNSKSSLVITPEDLVSGVMDAVRKVTIGIDGWSTDGFIKISALIPGLLFSWDEDDIYNFSLTEEASVYESSLSIPQATLTIDNSDGQFSVLSDGSLALELRDGLPISVYIQVGGHSVEMGEFKLKEWSTDDTAMQASFIMVPTIGLGQKFTAVGLTPTPMDDLIWLVARKLKIRDKVSFYLAEELSSISTIPYFGEGVDALTGLQQVANAGGHFAWQMGRDDTYYLLDMNWEIPTVARDITEDDMLSEPVITLRPAIAEINVQTSDRVSGEYTQFENLVVRTVDPGETFTFYSQNVQYNPNTTTQLQIPEAYADYILNWNNRRVNISVTIKGDPALMPLDNVVIEYQGNVLDTILTKVTTDFGVDVMQTKIEGVAYLP